MSFIWKELENKEFVYHYFHEAEYKPQKFPIFQQNNFYHDQGKE